MSVHRLQLEQSLREAEAEREEQDRLFALKVRAESQQLPAPPALVVRVLGEREAFETVTSGELDPSPYDLAANRVRRWWKNREKKPVTTAELTRLVRELRAMGKRK